MKAQIFEPSFMWRPSDIHFFVSASCFQWETHRKHIPSTLHTVDMKDSPSRNLRSRHKAKPKRPSKSEASSISKPFNFKWKLGKGTGWALGFFTCQTAFLRFQTCQGDIGGRFSCQWRLLNAVDHQRWPDTWKEPGTSPTVQLCARWASGWWHVRSRRASESPLLSSWLSLDRFALCLFSGAYNSKLFVLVSTAKLWKNTASTTPITIRRERYLCRDCLDTTSKTVRDTSH